MFYQNGCFAYEELLRQQYTTIYFMWADNQFWGRGATIQSLIAGNAHLICKKNYVVRH